MRLDVSLEAPAPGVLRPTSRSFALAIPFEGFSRDAGVVLSERLIHLHLLL